MIISEYTLKSLAKIVCGDVDYMPYQTGPELVHFFNKYGSDDIYEQGFPSRWKYTEDKLREFKESYRIKEIIEDVVDPRRFNNLSFTIEDAINSINETIKYDKLFLFKEGDFYKLSSLDNKLVEPETSKAINHDFINGQINKCREKITREDYSGAITNARSLVEAIFIEIIERYEVTEVRNDGDIEKLWKKVKKIMNLEINKDTLPDFVIQILSGLETSIKGLAGLSNNAADRHANKFKTQKHHAKLAVNLAMTLSDFLLDSWQFQHIKN